MCQRDGNTRAQQSQMLIAQHYEHNKHNEVDRLEYQIGHRVTASQRDVSHRQREHLEEHRQNRNLRHRYDIDKLTTEQ